MNSDFKVAIVTGASRGIGQSIALRLSEDGFGVVVNYFGNAEKADQVVTDIKRRGGKAIAVQADVSDTGDMEKLFRTAEQEFGGVDILVNNGGIMMLAPLSESSDELFDKQVAVNLKGTFNGIREGIKKLRNGGRIINMSSTVAALKFEKYGIYASTKAAVEVMTSIAAKELRGRNITVNAIAPGPTATELFLNGKPEEVVDKLAKAAPLERLGKPEDIAAAVSFLAGPDGSWINGQTIRANGGII